VLAQVRTVAGYRGRYFLIDTGADVSVAPRTLAERVGLDWNRLPVALASGIGRGHVTTRLGALPLQLGEIELTVRCLFLDRFDAPYILGCADVFDRFAVTIDAGQRKIILTEIN
jgi:hypothetical protein